jgi:ankyrin repeat protein
LSLVFIAKLSCVSRLHDVNLVEVVKTAAANTMSSSLPTTLSILPTELILLIAAHLTGEKDLNALIQTNRKFHTFFNDRLYQTNVDQNHSTGLFWAAANNQKHTIEMFLEHGATLTQTTQKRAETPFILAADAGHLSLVKWLLTQPGVDATVADKQGRTPLMRACSNGRTEVVRFLLTLENINAAQGGPYSATPLRLATDGGHADIFRLLLESSEEVAIQPELNLNTHMCVYRAITKNHRSIVSILIEEHGLDPNFADPERKMSLMHYAAINRSEAVVEYLLSVGAHPDPVSGSPCTPFTHAVRGRSLGVMKLLLDTRKVNVDFAEGFSRTTPLMSAAANGYDEIARDLIHSDSVDINKKDLHGQTPLYHAAKHGRVYVAELLLSQEGIVTDSPDFRGETPFMAAIRGRHADVVELFFKREDIGWDVPDRHRHTPLLVAASVNKEAIVQGLLAKGARIDCKDEHGRTPFAWAKWWQNEEMEKILAEYSVRQRYRRPIGVKDRVMMIEGQAISPMVALAEEIRTRGRVE